MPTFSALTTLPGEASAAALGEALEQLEPAPEGVGVFEIEDGSGLWEVGAYFLHPPGGAVMELLAAAFGAKPFVISQLPDIDWVAHVRRELSPVDAGRFFIYGSHDADKVPQKGRIALQIEATVAFGTGHHATTSGCLNVFDQLLDTNLNLTKQPIHVADIGCGTAVLALAAAATALDESIIIASDIDAVAVEVAKANLVINQCENRVKCIESAGFEHPYFQVIAPFDLIFANILKGPLIELAPEISNHLKVGGFAILSGLLTSQAQDVIKAYEHSGHRLISCTDIGEWSTLLLEKL